MMTIYDEIADDLLTQIGKLICFHNCLGTFGICFGIMTGA
jgi:hypothetical protein